MTTSDESMNRYPDALYKRFQKASSSNYSTRSYPTYDELLKSQQKTLKTLKKNEERLSNFEQEILNFQGSGDEQKTHLLHRQRAEAAFFYSKDLHRELTRRLDAFSAKSPSS